MIIIESLRIDKRTEKIMGKDWITGKFKLIKENH